MFEVQYHFLSKSESIESTTQTIQPYFHIRHQKWKQIRHTHQQKIFQMARIDRSIKEFFDEQEVKSMEIRELESNVKSRKASERIEQMMSGLENNQMKIDLLIQNLNNPLSVLLLSTTFSETLYHENILSSLQSRLSELHSSLNSSMKLQTIHFLYTYLSNNEINQILFSEKLNKIYDTLFEYLKLNDFNMHGKNFIWKIFDIGVRTGSMGIQDMEKIIALRKRKDERKNEKDQIGSEGLKKNDEIKIISFVLEHWSSFIKCNLSELVEFMKWCNKYVSKCSSPYVELMKGQIIQRQIELIKIKSK